MPVPSILLSQSAPVEVVVLRFDGYPVLIIERGVKTLERMVTSEDEPHLVEMLWDGQVMFSMNREEVLENKFSSRDKIDEHPTGTALQALGRIY